MIRLSQYGTVGRKNDFPPLPGDGPKFVCGLTVYDVSKEQVVFSLGSNGDTQFEDAIHSRLPNSKIITVDPTLNHANLEKVRLKKHITFLNTAVGALANNYKSNTYKSTSLRDLFEPFEKVDILKMDIEHAEYQIFTIKSDCEILHAADQVLIEVHGQTPKPVLDWFSRCSMLIFSKEPNIWGCQGTSCGEFAFISPDFAFQEYLMSR